MLNIIKILKRKYGSFLYRASLKSFHFFERLGVHVTPVHYYSPIPDTRGLDRAVFENDFSLTGVAMNEEEQLRWLESVGGKYGEEFSPRENSGLSLADSFMLYATLRERKPEMMVEIGSGESTRISLEALQKNKEEGHPCRFYAVEPYPGDYLRGIDLSWFTLIEKNVEKTDLDFLAGADVLFIDSSHVSRIGGDVNFEMLELVPRLKRGALIHWHDIMIPGNYWRDWTMEGNKFWNESYFLHAFLLFNSAFRVRWASRFMQERFFAQLQQAFPFVTETHRNSSFWVERVE